VPALALPNADLDWLRRRVSNFAEDRPGVYRMMGPGGRVMYVGKAKAVRNRLLSYFRAHYPDDKAARILHAASDIEWKYMSSEFAAYLEELREIKRYRPVFNVRMNRTRRAVLIKVSGGPAPKLLVGSRPGTEDVRHYGPFTSAERVRTGVKVLNDLLGLRDCALSMPMIFAEQGDLFQPDHRAACMRYDFGTCTGPCAGLVGEGVYRERIEATIDFLEGRSLAPIDSVVAGMQTASEGEEFERATWWRDRFDALEWLLQASTQARNAIESLSFVYRDPGSFGDDRVYLIRRATVRAVAPAPTTPIEREAFRGVVAEHVGQEPCDVPLPVSDMDEMLLLLRWFKSHPSAMRRTVPLTEWLDDQTPPC
jgi:excinuclease UvrABC nuclease subunit